jgi:hypothetical protein
MKNALRIATVALGLLALGGVAYAGFATGDGGHGRSTKHAPPARHLTVTGHVGDIYPGRTTTLWVKVRNPFDRDVSVRTVSADVASAGAACTGAVLTVQSLSGLDVRIAPHHGYRIPMQVSLRAGTIGCQGARWPLRYHVTATGIPGAKG